MLLLVALGCSDPPDQGLAPRIVEVGGPRPIAWADVEEAFRISVPERADWLFVVDAAPGSEAVQQQLVDELPALLEPLVWSGTDGRIGVVAADPDAEDLGFLRTVDGAAWMDPTSDRAELAERLSVGVSGTRTSPTLAIVAALTNPDLDAFLRVDTPLHLLVVGSGADDASPEELPVVGFDAWLGSTHPDATLHCVVASEDGGRCAGHAEASGGAVAVPALVEPVALAAAGFTRDFALSRWPTPDTVEVYVEAEAFGGIAVFQFEPSEWSWSPEANVLSFRQFVPAAGSMVRVAYVPDE
jgi:hypothetical protein